MNNPRTLLVVDWTITRRVVMIVIEIKHLAPPECHKLHRSKRGIVQDTERHLCSMRA